MAAPENPTPKADANSAELFARYCAGERQAADVLFERYVVRLTALARSRLSPKLASRTDPEDIVMSAYRSFFIRARDGQFSLQRSGDLWRLLVAITLHKLYRQAAHHRAEKRSLTAEQSLDGDWATLMAAKPEPSPDDAVAMADELENVMREFDPFARRVLELRLQGESLAEIARETRRSERTVRRTLTDIRENLARRLKRYQHD